ncbi:Fic family protein [Candidatus Saccharibacteria bacterium]|nr:Fic family protein [Candidatus Saccharibacteria bacterium]
MKLFHRESLPNNDSPPEEESSWSSAMEGVDDFSTHMAKMKTERPQAQETSKTQRALEIIGVVESRGDEKNFEEDLANLDAKDAVRILDFVNGTLTGKKRDQRRARGYGVWSGAEIHGHLSPASEVQATAIEETWDAIKNDINDNRKRAALVYYMTNHLHLFKDGNGRTSRVMYEVFSKRDFQIVGSDFHHLTDNQDEVGNGERFLEKNNLRYPSEVGKMTIDLVKQDLLRSSKLPDKMGKMNVYLNLPDGERPMPDVFLTDDAENNLDYFEKKVVQNAFFEKPIATLALGMMLEKKNRFDSIMRYYAEKENPRGEKYAVFDIEKKDEWNAEETFYGWKADDYREYCDIVKNIQLQQARKMIDIFKHEDKYKMPNGKTYADYFSGL